MSAPLDAKRVFLNVPFDAAYEPVFIGLVAALACLGKRPVTVLDIQGPARPRIDRLLGTIQSCAVSVHDLSRVEMSGRGRAATPRFNMPFELGLAVAMSRSARGTPHAFAVLKAKPFRLQRSLSDMNAYDPLIHAGKARGAIACMFELFSDVEHADFLNARRTAESLTMTARQLKRAHGTRTLFSRIAVKDLMTSAMLLQ